VVHGLALACKFHVWHSWEGQETTTGAFGFWCKTGAYCTCCKQFQFQFPIALIIDGIDISTTAIVSISMSQHITSMAPSAGDDDTIDDASMADP
jgi:hypothetical protein